MTDINEDREANSIDSIIIMTSQTNINVRRKTIVWPDQARLLTSNDNEMTSVKAMTVNVDQSSEEYYSNSASYYYCEWQWQWLLLLLCIIINSNTRQWALLLINGQWTNVLMTILKMKKLNWLIVLILLIIIIIIN